MEKKISNLHMDRIKCQDETQFTIDEDKNINERSADIVKILMEDGNIIVEEVRSGKDQADVRGKVKYTILYISEDADRKICKITGEVAFEEKIRVEGMEPSDNAVIKAELEDLRSSCINSRKINIKGIIRINGKIHETYDEEVISDIEYPNIEKKKDIYEISSIAICRRDLFRIKEETELPNVFPPVQEVLWKSLRLKKWEVRPLEDSISIQGELAVFLLYKALGETEEIRYYDTLLPFSGNLECAGSHSGMMSNIIPNPLNMNVNMKQDYDGEDRILEAEMVLELPINLYETKQMEVVSDVYGKNEIIRPVYRKAGYRKAGEKQQAKIKISKTAQIPASAPKILQICYTDSKIKSIYQRQNEAGEVMEGTAEATLLYVTDNEEMPFYILKEELPFEYQMDRMKEGENSKWEIFCLIQECKAILLDAEQAEIKINLIADLQPISYEERDILEEVKREDMEAAMRNKLPSMIVYRPSFRESVWDIGKKHLVSTEMIKKINQLEKEEVEEGEKLLLVR